MTGATGLAGELRAGGRLAGRLSDWTMEPAPGGWSIRARLHDGHPVYLANGTPLELRLTMGKRIWRWRGVACARAGEAVTLMATGDYDQL